MLCFMKKTTELLVRLFLINYEKLSVVGGILNVYQNRKTAISNVICCKFVVFL